MSDLVLDSSVAAKWVLPETDSRQAQRLISPVAVWLAAALIVAVTVAAYSNSLGAPLIFDDFPSIVENRSIRRLWPISVPLSPPIHGEAVTGRPLLNLSFALDYAFGGTEPQGYHLANLAIHVAAALVLFGLLRRTFLLLGRPIAAAGSALNAGLLRPTTDRNACAATTGRNVGPPTVVAAIIALLWAVHPLQTESVTYVVQRAESLMGLCYLLVLYGLVRGAGEGIGDWGLGIGLRRKRLGSSNPPSLIPSNPPSPIPHPFNLWYAVSALACLAGMATKEVMASAPLVALLYDRTFLAGSFREALRRRWGLYLALVAAWPVVESELVSSWGRGSFGGGISPWRYLATQCGAVAHYLRLCLWPSSLVLDYGQPLAYGAAQIAPYAVLVGGLLVITLLALWRWPKVGFLGAWFFLLLAPSSSVVPQIMQTIAEHRMYLPLAAVVTLAVVAAQAGLGRLSDRRWLSQRGAERLGLFAAAAAGLALAVATFERNATYGDDLSIWRDTLHKVPSNARAQNNVGVVLLARGELDEAIGLFYGAMMSQATDPIANYNYHINLARRASIDAAIAECRTAVHQRPDSAEAQASLAWRLATCPSASRRDAAAALEHALTARRLSGGRSPDVLDALAAAYADRGRFPEAIATAQAALALAEKQGKSKLAQDLRARLALYQSGKPYREKIGD
jgi:tetratricopeptide (TPR) repeat protein